MPMSIRLRIFFTKTTQMFCLKGFGNPSVSKRTSKFAGDRSVGKSGRTLPLQEAISSVMCKML